MFAFHRGLLRAFLIILAVAAPRLTSAADLVDVYARARESDPDYLAAQYTLEAERQKVPEAISALLPNISATGTNGHTTGNTVYTGTPEVRRGFNSYAWKVQLAQPLLHATGAAVLEESNALVAQATALYEQAKQDLIVRTVQAYFDVLAATEAVAAAHAERRATSDQVQATRHAYDDGTGTLTDVDEAKSRSAQAEAKYVSAVGNLQGKRDELERIIGTVPTMLASLEDHVVGPRPDPDDPAVWSFRAKQGNAAVLAQKAAVDAAEAEVTRVKFQRMPTIDFVAATGRTYSSGNIDNPIDYGTRVGDQEFALQVSMPIIDGGGIHASIREAIANSHKAAAQLESAQRKAVADAREAYSEIVNGLSQIRALEAAVASGNSSVKGNSLGYALGIRINSDVLDSEQQLYSARRDLVKARYDTLVAGVKLKAAAGDLRESDVFLLNSLLTEDMDTTAKALVD